MADRIRGHVYFTDPRIHSSQLLVAETRAGDQHVTLWTCDTDGEHRAVLLDAHDIERLGIDLQIRASYMRGVRPPTGPEPDPADPEPDPADPDPGPDDVPLIEVDADAP